MTTTLRLFVASTTLLAVACTVSAAADKLVTVDLAYRAPGTGPAPNFSPKGTQVQLTAIPASIALPEGAARPAKTGAVPVGPNRSSWVPILVTADPQHPHDLCRLYIDANRNGNFDDDGPPLTAVPTQNEKTKAWWSSFNRAQLSVPYGPGVTEPYMVNFWAVREGDDTPGIIRYSVASWRSGTIAVNGAQALLAMMDSDNDALFTAKDMWSALAASETDAAKRVLSIAEARATGRLMFLQKPDGTEVVLEFRSVTPDGRTLQFAAVDRPVTKKQDRAPDDTLAAERARPRTTRPFPWTEGHLDQSLALAKQSGRKVIIDFWATWCGPCHTLDEWIFSDAEVAGVLHAGYIGVKLDGDIEKDLAARFHVTGFPTLIVLDSAGKEQSRYNYLSSKEILEALKR